MAVSKTRSSILFAAVFSIPIIFFTARAWAEEPDDSASISSEAPGWEQGDSTDTDDQDSGSSEDCNNPPQPLPIPPPEPDPVPDPIVIEIPGGDITIYWPEGPVEVIHPDGTSDIYWPN